MTQRCVLFEYTFTKYGKADLKHAQYGFARSYGFLDDPDFSPYWHKVMIDVSMNGHMLKQFGFFMPMMKAMPRWMVKLLQPQMMTLIDFQEVRPSNLYLLQ